MSDGFELNVKKEIPSEQETKIRILSIAINLGCKHEVDAVFDKYKEFSPFKNSPAELVAVAKSLINDLYKIDPKLVLWLMNDNGEIVVGNEVAMKINFV